MPARMRRVPGVKRLVVPAALAATFALSGCGDDTERPEPEILTVLVEPGLVLFPDEALRVEVVVQPGSVDRPIAGGVVRRDGAVLVLFESIAESSFRAEVPWEDLVASSMDGAAGEALPVPVEIEFVDLGGSYVSEVLDVSVGCRRSEEALCGGTCASLVSDDAHCGGCHNECFADFQLGMLQSSCRAGETGEGECATSVLGQASSVPESCDSICGRVDDFGLPLACSPTCVADFDAAALDTTSGSVASVARYDGAEFGRQSVSLFSCAEVPPASLQDGGSSLPFLDQVCCCLVEYD